GAASRIPLNARVAAAVGRFGERAAIEEGVVVDLYWPGFARGERITFQIQTGPVPRSLHVIRTRTGVVDDVVVQLDGSLRGVYRGHDDPIALRVVNDVVVNVKIEGTATLTAVHILLETAASVHARDGVPSEIKPGVVRGYVDSLV